MPPLDKKSLSERDICTKFITPALVASGWDLLTQVREEVFFTKGRVIVRGKTVKRGEAKFADYLLYFKPNIPLGVIEAKDNNHSIGAGMQQALGYADKNALDLPFVFSSNGDGFSSTTARGPTRRSSRNSPSTRSRRRMNCGNDTASGRRPRRIGCRSSPRATTTTAPARRPVTTSSTPSTARSRQSPTGKIAF